MTDILQLIAILRMIKKFIVIFINKLKDKLI